MLSVPNVTLAAFVKASAIEVVPVKAAFEMPLTVIVPKLESPFVRVPDTSVMSALPATAKESKA